MTDNYWTRQAADMEDARKRKEAKTAARDASIRRMLADGLAPSEIAAALNINEKTVRKVRGKKS